MKEKNGKTNLLKRKKYYLKIEKRINYNIFRVKNSTSLYINKYKFDIIVYII